MFSSAASAMSGIRSAHSWVKRVRSGLPTKSPTVPPCISASAGLSETIVPVFASTTVVPRLVRLKQISHIRRRTSPAISLPRSRPITIISTISPASSRTARATVSHST